MGWASDAGVRRGDPLVPEEGGERNVFAVYGCKGMFNPWEIFGGHCMYMNRLSEAVTFSSSMPEAYMQQRASMISGP